MPGLTITILYLTVKGARRAQWETDRGSSNEHFPSHFFHIEPATTQRQSHVKAAYAATAPTFQIALTTNRLRGRAPGYSGQTPLCARLRGVLRLHENRCREEFSSTPLYSFRLYSDSIANNRGGSFSPRPASKFRRGGSSFEHFLAPRQPAIHITTAMDDQCSGVGMDGEKVWAYGKSGQSISGSVCLSHAPTTNQP